MSVLRTVLAAAILCVLAVIVAAKKGPSPTAPIYTNYVANVTELVVQAGQPEQSANVLISWQMDDTRNRTAYTGPNIQPLVADFTGLTVYYLDYYHICQYTCALDFNTPCDDQINGAGLCSYDQINRSQYLDEEEIDGVQAYHYIWQDPLAGISMAQHELWVNAQTGYPAVMKADFHPFGTWEANITISYNSFTAGTPPAANFAFTNEQYCYPGTEEQCNDTVRRLGRYMRMAPKAPKKVLTEQ